MARLGVGPRAAHPDAEDRVRIASRGLECEPIACAFDPHLVRVQVEVLEDDWVEGVEAEFGDDWGGSDSHEDMDDWVCDQEHDCLCDRYPDADPDPWFREMYEEPAARQLDRHRERCRGASSLSATLIGNLVIAAGFACQIAAGSIEWAPAVQVPVVGIPRAANHTVLTGWFGPLVRVVQYGRLRLTQSLQPYGILCELHLCIKSVKIYIILR